MSLKRVRGFPDYLPEESFQRESLLSLIAPILRCFDFQKVEIPLLESSDLFSRTLGEDSDIVNKEMYSFQNGEEYLTLRPEGTASIARMFITQKLQKSLPLRWYYHGPMFRRERPQKGRFRQFYQLGVELLGDSSETADVEILSLAWQIFKKLGIEKKLVLEINSLGSLEERKQYREKLKTFLQPFKKQLSSESQIRLEKNPLRIWDSKDKSDQDIMTKAPLLEDSLKNSSLKKYERVKKLLDDLNIAYRENKQLVRGLDYYNDLVFEWTNQKELGTQSTVLAGGRYDSLIETLGGTATPAVGWALGLERLCLLYQVLPKHPLQIGLLAHGDPAKNKAFQLVHSLRTEGFEVFYRFSGNFSKQMKRISQNCLFALIYGEKEHSQGEIVLKNLQKEKQKKIPLSSLTKELKQIFINK